MNANSNAFRTVYDATSSVAGMPVQAPVHRRPVGASDMQTSGSLQPHSTLDGTLVTVFLPTGIYIHIYCIKFNCIKTLCPRISVYFLIVGYCSDHFVSCLKLNRPSDRPLTTQLCVYQQ